MIKRLIQVCATAVLLRWGLFVIGLAGNSQAEVPDERPRSIIDLRLELGDLRPDAAAIFEQGYTAHIGGNLAAASAEYDKLRRLPLTDGQTFDLARSSRVLRHNIELIAKKTLGA